MRLPQRSLAIACSITVSVAMTGSSNAMSQEGVVNLEHGRSFVASLHHKQHSVRAVITVRPKPSGWPMSTVIGSIWDDGSRLVSAVKLTVDGCDIMQGTAPIVGFSRPAQARLYAVGDRWAISIVGGEDAATYQATFMFDKVGIVASTIEEGSVFTQKARYRYEIDREVIAPACE